jgi:hypothetical protein
MDYEEINKGLKEMNNWKTVFTEWEGDYWKDFDDPKPTILGGKGADIISFDFGKPKEEDKVNSPKHYTAGKVEVIDVIEDAIEDAPTPKVGMLQAQVIKYILRMWLKDNPVQDAEKAEWYLKRLIESLK